MTDTEPEQVDLEDVKRTEQVKAAIGGDNSVLRDLTEKHLGTRDLDEADRRTRVIWEWREQNEQ